MSTTVEPPNQQDFRTTIATVDAEGRRVWLHPKKPSGRYHRGRIAVSVLLLAVLFGLPWIRDDGHPFMLFNVIDREFILFGRFFGPQDFYLFGLLMLSTLVGLILFTVVYGRIFCGWICPQTIFMEMVFRKIEYWIDGDYIKQRNLQKSPWTTDKVLKRAAKHLIFFAISFLIANTFLAYIVGVAKLEQLVADGPAAHFGAFSALVVFSLMFYGVFMFLREQVCIVACPYGRLQGLMLDQNSIVVAYDTVRGEPRGKLGATTGDCIACNQCVVVCPTGIDIRNGTQLECVNCTACIDACDDIMDKVHKPRGLVRYASMRSVAESSKLRLSSRIIAYTAVLLLLVTVTTTLLILHKDLGVTILRERMMWQQQPDESVLNLYNVQLVNKTFKPREVAVRLAAPAGGIEVVGHAGNRFRLAPQAVTNSVMLVRLPHAALHSMRTDVRLEFTEDGEVIRTENVRFPGPAF